MCQRRRGGNLTDARWLRIVSRFLSLQRIRFVFTNSSLILKFFAQLRRKANLPDVDDVDEPDVDEPDPELFI